MTKAEEIAKKWGILHYESGDINKDVLEALNEALRQPPVSGELQGFFEFYKQKFGGGFNTDVLEITLKQYQETL